MPNYNGTGPQGTGPGTGRGLGPCGAGNACGRGYGRGQGRVRGFGGSGPYGRGYGAAGTRGFGRGHGRGPGRGLGWFTAGYGTESDADRVTGYREALEARAAELRSELARMESLIVESADAGKKDGEA